MGDQRITIKFGLKDFKKHYDLSCPNPSITWKEFITSNCKVPFVFGDDEYIVQRHVLKNGKTEILTFFLHQKISDFLKTFKRNFKNRHVKVVKKPINLKSPTAKATETVAPSSEPRPSTSGNTKANANCNGNSSSPKIIFIKPAAVRPVSPAITLSKRGPGRTKVTVKVNNSPTGAGNKSGQASAPVTSPRGQNIKKNLFNLNMTFPMRNAETTMQFGGSNGNGIGGPVNGFDEGQGDNMTVMSESTQEDLSLEDIKAIIVQRWVKNFTNADFHLMVNEYRDLKSKGKGLKICRLLPWLGNCLEIVFQEPFKK